MQQHFAAHREAPQRARGKGRLVTKLFDGRTRLSEFYQEGCAKIRLPDTFSPDMEAILINTSGGLTGGDVIEWSVAAAASTRLTVTTQANEKVYRAASGTASLTTNLRVAANAALHWMPQETILFDQSSLSRRLEVDLHDTSEFLAVEAVLMGRQAMGERLNRGLFRDRWRVRRGGRLVHAEDVRFEGEVNAVASQPATLAGQTAFATVLYVGPLAEALLPKVRDALGLTNGGASRWNGKLVVRLIASSGFELRKVLVPVITVLRNGAPVPKVWNI
ncbi:urease accessory protein [Pseudorhizobium tarimense]|uniref:Urease accessory protein UreD n=1 Tax=Pseudorhizobium tarimense TaxID=1079109 RepID=A0ABV2H7F4_9HYPH|nr:urease accessory protein UreD [Pseudorhizobium tarimense]MCJ8519687.1 urease accessory protein UreD [Pseudorhizobium tarimense]